MVNLHCWKPDQAEKHKGYGTGFSWGWASHVFKTGFDVRAFRQSQTDIVTGRP